jgi:hypothetical protein
VVPEYIRKYYQDYSQSLPPDLRLALVWDYSFQKILWKLMVGRYGERITLMEKELHLFLVYLKRK